MNSTNLTRRTQAQPALKEQNKPPNLLTTLEFIQPLSRTCFSNLNCSKQLSTAALSIPQTCSRNASQKQFSALTCFAKPSQEWERQPYSFSLSCNVWEKTHLRTLLWSFVTLANLLTRSRVSLLDCQSSWSQFAPKSFTAVSQSQPRSSSSKEILLRIS